MNFDIAVPSLLSRARRLKVPLQGPLLVALAYLLGAEVAFYIGTLSDQIFALVWPTNVVLLCALMIVPQRDWWLYIVAAFLAHVVAELGVALRQIGLNERHANARRVLRWIRAHKKTEVSLKDVRRDALSQSLDADQTQALLDGLVKAGWLPETIPPTPPPPVRPSTLHP